MSKLIEWIDSKYEYINSEIEKMKLLDIDFDNKNTHPIYCEMLSCNNDFKSMQSRRFENPDEVLYCLRIYQKIVATINCFDVFVPSIENFCMFMGWTAKMYKQMLQDTLPDIMDTMQMIEDYLIESQLSAGQSGIAKPNLTKFRVQTSGAHGNELVTQKEKNEDDRITKKLKTAEQLQKELANMGVNILPNQK